MKPEKLAFKDVEAFDHWLTKIVKNVHTSHDESMIKAYDRVYSNSLDLITIKSK
jgi:hypothetical protein